MITDWCSWWFEWLHGYCCFEHDMGGTDAALWACVKTSPIADHVGGILATGYATLMYLGVTFGRPLYVAWKERRNPTK